MSFGPENKRRLLENSIGPFAPMAQRVWWLILIAILGHLLFWGLVLGGFIWLVVTVVSWFARH